MELDAPEKRLRKILIRDLNSRYQVIGHNMDEVNQFYGYHFKPGYFQYVIFRLDKDEPAMQQEFVDQVRSCLQSIASFFPNEMEYLAGNTQINLLYDIPSGEEYCIQQLQQQFQQIGKEMNEALAPKNRYIAIGIGKLVTKLNHINESMDVAERAIEYILLGKTDGKKVFADAQICSDNMEEVISLLELKNLRSSILALDFQEIDTTLDRLFQKADQLYPDYPIAYLYSHRVISQVGSILYSQVGRFEYYRHVSTVAHDKLASCRSQEEILSSLKCLIRKLAKPYQESLESQDWLPVQTARHYIDLHFTESDLTLERTAEKIHLSAPYLSRLFKEKTGMTFSEYLGSLRMDEAKRMLRDSTYSIQDIASCLGYRDPKYFSRIFHSKEHCTPIEYRRQNATTQLPPM